MLPSYSLVALALLASQASGTYLKPAPELFSPLISSKPVTIANVLKDPANFPQYTDRVNGIWEFFSPTTWTSGFFPALLYQLDTRSKLCHTTSHPNFLSLGRTWSLGLVPLQEIPTLDHDVGFLSYPFMQELRVNPANASAQTAVIKFAHTLASRFNPLVGCTRSWNTADTTDFQVIIDNMMNLEVLFAAADLTGNQTLRDIAITHADTTIKNHFRPDWSTYHVVEYNSTTGAIIKRRTAQGFSDDSTWTRGHSWAIYGYANMFNRTGLTRYMDTARNAAKFYLSRVPASDIVPWDFDAPGPLMADTSSSTIAAAGLLLMAEMEEKLAPPNHSAASQWRQSALKLLNAATKLAWNPSWQSLLSNGTVNNPAHNNLTGTIYGDYHYVLAGNMLLSRGLAQCP